jgi:hypothetical protein
LNCSQARALLATYRELNNEEKAQLDEHLEHCDACAQEFAHFQMISQAFKKLPSIAPSPDAHTRLMHALAEEHVRFLQHTPTSATSTPTPAFLAPYIKDISPKKPAQENLAAFSTANTGPLPVIDISKHTKRRYPGQMSHITVIGLAASFLLVLMLGGFGSLLLLANQGSQHVTSISSGGGAAIVVKPLQVSTNQYTTTSAYDHIASAVANDTHIYSTSYTDGATNWMLEQSNLDNTAQPSVPLLSSPSSNPIFVLGSSQNWLFWLQLDKSAQGSSKNTNNTTTTTKTLAGTWSLRALYIGTQPTTPSDTQNSTPDATKALILHQDTFKPAKSPSWVNTPVQGIWFYQDSLLVAYLDSKGTSHLVDYQFSQDTLSQTTNLASAHNGHVLTSPTASNNGNSIFWSEEWLDAQQDLQSNIWTQQVEVATPGQNGRWTSQTRTETYLFRADGLSFQPHVVDNTLFFLSATTKLPVSAQPSATKTPKSTPTETSVNSTPTSATATVSATATATATTPANSPYLGGSAKIDPTVLTPQLDTTVAGNLVAYSADGALQQQSPVNNTKAVVSDLQSGSQYIVWQNMSGNFEMYDVTSSSAVIIDPSDIGKNSAFMTVNGDSAIWTAYIPQSAAQTSTTNNVTITFGTFKWPDAKSGS